jgi:hypothetical protein
MRYSFLFILILSFNAAVSQDSLRWYSGKLKQLTFTITDNNGRNVGRIVFTRERADSSHKPALSLFGKATAYAAMFQGYGSNNFTDVYQIKVDTTGFYIDYGLLRNFNGNTFSKSEVIIIRDNALLFYPKNPQVGQELPSGMTVHVQSYIEQSGMGNPATRPPFRVGDGSNLLTDLGTYNKIDERKIIAKEFKTIMGKKLETFVIQHSISTAFKRDGKYREAGYMKEWYNLNTGLVAFAVYTKKDKLMTSGALTSVE